MKIRKKFEYNGITLQIVEREEPFMNAAEPVTMTRVIAPNGGTIPVKISHRDTLKAIMEKTAEALDVFAKNGADVLEVLTKPFRDA